MTGDRTSNSVDAASTCSGADCDLVPDFWVYHPEHDRWRPLCERHTLDLHPSIEIKVWLESGYARPAELGPPTEPPARAGDDRTAAFRDIVDRAMGWSE